MNEPSPDLRPLTDDESYRGLVLGTESEPATPLAFSMWVDPARFVQLDDVVHVQTTLPDGQHVDLFGVVDEVEARQEGVALTSDVALTRDGVLPAQQVTAAHVSVTRVEPEVYVPPTPGQPVALAREATRERALFFDKMRDAEEDHRFPLGVSRAPRAEVAEPVYGNLQFLDGTRGAHVNISGISGVATKTSYATFLLYALFHTGVLGPLKANAHALIFNVKGEDLLFLDRPNARLDDASRALYGRLGLPHRAFESVRFFGPAAPNREAVPMTGSRQEDVTGYYWTLLEFCQKGLLRYLFTESDRETQILDLVEVVTARLRRAADSTPFGESEGNVVIEGIEVATMERLVEEVERNLVGDEGDEGVGRWSSSASRAASPGTVRAFLRRLDAGARALSGLVRGHEAGDDPTRHRIAFEGHHLTVVDINRLPERAQRFVVGVLLAQVMDERGSRIVGGRPAPFFVVVDELNKYAPRDGRSPIKEVLLDIAERGRSMGVVLIGAQQTASEVEPRIVANASFRVAGRLDPAEAQRNEYRFLMGAAQRRATLLEPGSMFVSQPQIPVPLMVQFPMPAWATRAQEVAPTETRERRLRRFDDVDPFDDEP